MKSNGALLAAQSVCLVLTALAPTAAAQNTAQPEAQVGANHSTYHLPQDFVVCTGWHALCSASTDCKMNGDKADCDCFRVNETHIVETSAIQDAAAKRRTQIECTNAHPCDVDQAPVCKAIKCL
jgi:hypothetical protein